MRARLALAGAAALASVPGVAAAQDGRFSVDVNALAGYANNPFVVEGDDTGSALVGVDVMPRFALVSERTTVTVSAAARLQQYLRRYSNNESYSGAIDFATRTSERVSFNGRLALASAIVGAGDNYLPGYGLPVTVAPLPGDTTGGTGVAPGIGTGIGVVDPGVLVPGYSDIGLFGLRNRRVSVTGTLGAQIALSERDSLSISGFGEAARFRRLPLANDYEGYGGTIGYSRQLNSNLRIGLQGSANAYDYRGLTQGSRVYAIEATAGVRLNQYWTLDGALGVSFVNGQVLGSTQQTSLSGNIGLCRRGALSSMCATASRQVRPTGLAGTQYVTTLGGNWSTRLSERENVSLSATYSDVGGNNLRLPGQVVPLQNKFLRFAAGYDRRLSERLRATAGANYRKLFGFGDDRSADFGGQVGLSYRFGDPR